MRVISAGKTDKGYVRANNEDGFLVDDELKIYAVADGMGGHKAGEIASRVTLDALRDTLKRDPKGAAAGSLLERGLQTAGIRMFAQIDKDPELRGMGTTLTGLLLSHENKATLVHVGDSRCYRMRAGKLTLLTEDHSWVWEQRKAGVLSEAEAATHPMRNVITRSVGHGGESNPDITSIDVLAGDTFMLCSDGLCGYVGDDQIAAAMAPVANDAKAVTDRLVQLALDAGGEDNVTVVALHVTN